MNASELIDLLRKHPRACETFRLKLVGNMFPEGWIVVQAGEDAGLIPPRKILDTAFHGRYVDDFRRWLVGACVEWCDTHDVHITQDCDAPGMFIRPTSQFAYDVYPSRLHAMLAAMEAHDRLAP